MLESFKRFFSRPGIDCDLSEIAQWKATTASMHAGVAALARADVALRFGHQWARLMANRADPDFLAKVAALKAEEEGAVAVRLGELMPVVNAQRTASRRLLSDRHRQQRLGLRRKWQTILRVPVSIDATDRFEANVTRLWRRVLFHAAGQRLTRGPGIRLVFQRKPDAGPPPADG